MARFQSIHLKVKTRSVYSGEIGSLAPSRNDAAYGDIRYTAEPAPIHTRMVVSESVESPSPQYKH